MNKELDVVIGYIKTLEDFHELRHIKLTKERNGKSYRVYRLSYLDANNKEIDVRLELNQKKKSFPLVYGMIAHCKLLSTSIS